MTRDVKAELNAMTAAISTAVLVMRPYLPLMHEYKRERQKMDVRRWSRSVRSSPRRSS